MTDFRQLLEERLWTSSWEEKEELFNLVADYVGIDHILGTFLVERVKHKRGVVATWKERGKKVRFFVADEQDYIQHHHFTGKFYESKELSLIEKHFEAGGTFLDVGANVGNHAIYVGKFLSPVKIVVIEPNPVASSILEVNVLLNELSGIVDLQYLDVGLSDHTACAEILTPPNNLGGARLYDHGDGSTRLTTGDSLLGEERIDFIKIDVEGMELSVLHGLTDTIRRFRPVLFIEVFENNMEACRAWIEAQSYEVLEHVDWPGYRNLVAGPVRVASGR